MPPTARSLAHLRLTSLAALVFAGAAACGDPYQHTNPYDDKLPVTITVSGPDTLFSAYEHGTFTAATDPALPDSAIHWKVNGFAGGRSADLVNATPPLWPQTFTAAMVAVIGTIDTTISLNSITIPTNTWRHEGLKYVVLTQRVTHIAMRCPDTHACDTLSAGGTWSVWVDGLDALNQKILSLTSATANPSTGTAIATFAARDQSVAGVTPVGIRAASVTALRSGSTWIVATRGTLLDSLQLVVR
jgi:hypothetical protein